MVIKKPLEIQMKTESLCVRHGVIVLDSTTSKITELRQIFCIYA